MQNSTLAVGSLAALDGVLGNDQLFDWGSNVDVVIVPTAAAFTGAAEAAVMAAHVLERLDARVEALMVTDRSSSAQPYFVERLAQADVVVLCDGSALHARSVWRNTPVGGAIAQASQLIALGGVASVLGEVMIDPRGGAPMIGLGYRPGVAFCAPASTEQLARTRSLLASDVTLVVLGPRGVLQFVNQQWRIVQADDVVVTRGPTIVELYDS